MNRKHLVGAIITLTLMLIGCQPKDESYIDIRTKIDGEAARSSEVNDKGVSLVTIDIDNYVKENLPELANSNVKAEVRTETEEYIKEGTKVTMEVTADGFKITPREMKEKEKVEELLAFEGKRVNVIFKRSELDYAEVIREVEDKIKNTKHHPVDKVDIHYYSEEHVMNEVIEVKGEYLIVVTDKEKVLDTYNSVEDIK